MKWYKYDIRNMTDAEYDKWYLLMSDDKQRTINRFRLIDDKRRSVAGEMLARKAIADWCNIAPETIFFDIGINGKPYAKDLSVEFNISHSGTMVVCAIDDKPIGIDIEKIRPIDLSVAKRICTSTQLLYLFGHIPAPIDFTYTDDLDTLTRFFELWTAKEAYGKRIGIGIESGKEFKNSNIKTIIIEQEYVLSVSKY